MTREERLAAREARKASLVRDAAEQEARDLEAIDELEIEHGDANVRVVPVGFVRLGMPCRLAVRTPSDAAMKRFRAQLQPKKEGQQPDAAAAAIALGVVCRIYPPKDPAGDALYAEILAARPGVDVLMGTAAARLAAEGAADEGKD